MNVHSGSPAEVPRVLHNVRNSLTVVCAALSLLRLKTSGAFELDLIDMASRASLQMEGQLAHLEAQLCSLRSSEGPLFECAAGRMPSADTQSATTAS